jgi:hypothetical protein
MVLSVAFRKGVFWGPGSLLVVYLRLYLLRHIILLACIIQHLTADKGYALFDHQDTVFYGSVHGFTFDVKAGLSIDFFWFAG